MLHRIRLTALALALAVPACGGSDRAARPTPSERASATASPAGAIRVGAEPGATSAPASAAPAQTPSGGEQVPADDAPAAALKAYLDAWDAEDYESQLKLSVDGAQALTRVRDVIRLQNAERGAKTNNRVTVSEGPATTERTDASATVSVKARITSLVSGEKEPRASVSTVDGPVQMQNVNGAWLVKNYVYSERPLVYVHVQESQTVRDLRLDVGSLVSYKRTTAALVRVVNDRPGMIDVDLTASLSDAAGKSSESSQVVAEPGNTPLIVLIFPRVESAARLHVAVTDTKSGDKRDYEFKL